MQTDYPIKILRVNRRSISIHFDNNGTLIVKSPHLIPEFIIQHFLHQKDHWIKKQYQKFSSFSKTISHTVRHGDSMLYLGTVYTINVTNTTSITVDNQIHFPQALEFRIVKELTNWLKNEAKRIITERVNYYSTITHTNFRSISFSDTSSKWGSCSPENHLQFSWRLVMAPLLVIDYVVVHELVHTIHKHHQKSFWGEVEQYKPAYRQYIKWLKTNGPQIHTILPKS